VYGLDLALLQEIAREEGDNQQHDGDEDGPGGKDLLLRRVGTWRRSEVRHSGRFHVKVELSYHRVLFPPPLGLSITPCQRACRDGCLFEDSGDDVRRRFIATSAIWDAMMGRQPVASSTLRSGLRWNRCLKGDLEGARCRDAKLLREPRPGKGGASSNQTVVWLVILAMWRSVGDGSEQARSTAGWEAAGAMVVVSCVCEAA